MIGKSSPLNDHTIATEVRMIISLPSNHNASHILNCWENGIVLTNKVMYHFVPQAEEEIMFRCCYQLQSCQKQDGTAYERLIQLRHEVFH